MVKKLFGKKLGTTRFFLDEGKSVPVTVLKIGPCVVVQKKGLEKEKYNAIQVGFETVKENRINKPSLGHFKKAGTGCFAHLGEIRVNNPDGFDIGQEIKSDIFNVGDLVDVSGVSKGRGFAGVIKRHKFHGGKATHGSMFHRAPGSIGQSAYPSRVLPGMRAPGQMGNERVTVQNLKVVDIKEQENILLVKGAVPGHNGGYVVIKKA